MPGHFRFSLQHVLDYRRHLMDNARLELVAVKKAYQVQARLVEETRSKLEAAAAYLHGRQVLPAEEYWLWTTYRERLLQDLHQAEAGLQVLAARVAICRKDLIQKTKELKILERLRNKQALDYHVQEKRIEQKEIDEMATLRHHYKGF